MLVSAPAGSGKTTLLATWRDALDAAGSASAWIDLAPLHADPGSFLAELAREMDRATQRDADADGFGASLMRRLSSFGARDPHRLARLLAEELRELGEVVPIFLDNYHRLPPECPVDQLISQVLREAGDELHLVVATRGAAPGAATRLLAEGRALKVAGEDLSLRTDQLEQILKDRRVDLDSADRARLLAQTSGWATGVLLAARVIAEGRAGETSRFVEELSTHPDLFAYVASELLSGESDETIGVLENAALLGSASRPVLESLCGPGAADGIDAAIGKGLLLQSGERLALHPLWEALLRGRIRRRLASGELRDRVARTVEVLEASGEPERAMELCVELEQPELGVGVIERHGLDWFERGLHENVSRWLAAVEPAAGDSPDLVLVRALLDGRRDAARACDALEMAAERFRERGDLDRELAARHNTMMFAANANLETRSRRAVVRMVRLRRLIASPEALATATLFIGLAAGFRGRFGLARRLLDRSARHRFSPRERGALASIRSQLSILAGEWERTVQITEQALADPEQRSHGPSYFILRSMRALARGVLGRDLDACLEQLEECREAFADYGLGVCEAESNGFMGRLLAKERRFDEARAVLDRSLQIYAELGATEGQANAHSLLARVQRELGNGAAARRHASATLEVFDQVARLRRRPWSGALAAGVLAEEGDVEAAVAFVARHARSLDVPDLPMSQHATHVALARIAELGGDEAGTTRHLERALAAAAEADLRIAMPDMEPALLRWAREAARERGLDGSVAERLDPSSGGAGRARVAAHSIVTLGAFHVERDGEKVESSAWRGANAQRLFQRLLVANGRPLSREQLGVEFWPDASPAKARHSLRSALNKLRRTLEPSRSAGDREHWLRVEGEHLSLREEALAGWDVARWRESLAADDLERRVDAIGAYTGPFLPDTLDDWALELRGELEARLAREGQRTLEMLLDAGRADEAWEVAGCLLAQDPADEIAWVGRVRAEMARRDAAAARRELDRARQTLRRELDAEPGEALQALESELGAG